MSEKVKAILWVVVGLLSAVAIFSLVVAVGCSINGLTFGEQICDWFSKNPQVIS